MFLLIFITFYWFDKNQIVKKNSNFPQDLSLSNMVRKTKFLSILGLVSEIVTFLTKKKSSL